MNKKYCYLNNLILVCIVLLTACERRLPLYGSPKHNALHGIINDGKTVNQITLFNDRNNFRPTLRFDPKITVYAGTLGWDAYKNPAKIRPGWANSVEFSLAFTTEHKIMPIKSTPEEMRLDSIGVDLIANLGGNSAWVAQQVEYHNEIIANSPIRNRKSEWDLYEYMVVKEKFVRHYIYVPSDQRNYSGRNYPFRISCNTGALVEDKVHHLTNCVASFLYEPDISVTYTFSPKLLPHWREIYQQLHVFLGKTVQR